MKIATVGAAGQKVLEKKEEEESVEQLVEEESVFGGRWTMESDNRKKVNSACMGGERGRTMVVAPGRA